MHLQPQLLRILDCSFCAFQLKNRLQVCSAMAAAKSRSSVPGTRARCWRTTTSAPHATAMSGAQLQRGPSSASRSKVTCTLHDGGGGLRTGTNSWHPLLDSQGCRCVFACYAITPLFIGTIYMSVQIGGCSLPKFPQVHCIWGLCTSTSYPLLHFSAGSIMKIEGWNETSAPHQGSDNSVTVP